jgi:OOP family OmpA-OmpF porin
MMKFLYLGLLLASVLSTFAQETENDTIDRHNFNHWSVELNLGQNIPIKPFGNGYYASKPTFFNFNGVGHYDIGVRYMFSNVFGLKFDAAYDKIEDQNGSGSLEFETKQYRLGIQGVINLGRVFRFETFTNRIGLLAHGGIQVSHLSPKMGVNSGLTEQNGGIMYGLTPQYRISNWLLITSDFSGFNNFRQHFNWDGSYSANENSLSGTIYTMSLGLTVYFGDKDKEHADWYIPAPPVAKADEETKKRVAEIETLMNDTDKDGVPDYLDQENNTPAGVTVDSRGKFIDINNNGVPDELERKTTPQRIDQDFSYDDVNNTTRYSTAVLKSLVENGHVNIFFDVNKDTPNSGSSNSVQQLYQYLMKYPDSRIILYGYADLTGEESKNKNLSERRAKNIKNFFVASGIPSSRITIAGQGVDKTFPAGTKTGLDLARRVSIEIVK